MIEGLVRPDLLREQAYIDGLWQHSTERFPVTNPATGAVIAAVANMGAAETQLAIAAAKRAQPTWAAKTAKERVVILRRWHDLMMVHQEDLAQIMTTEQGKPLAESRGEIAYAAAFLEWFAEEEKRAYGEVIPSHRIDHRLVTIRQPVGVVTAITPWNFPAAMIDNYVHLPVNHLVAASEKLAARLH